MSSKQISPLLQTWYKWKALRLPWRKRFLVGLDLQGNTYWEFQDVRGGDPAGARWRRIVQYPRATHYGEVRPTPQWHQWLRHLRESPPSLQEQHAEVRRQHQIKHLAAQADARWDAKPRLVDAGPGGRRDAALPEARGEAGTDGGASVERSRAQAGGEPGREQKSDPWKHHRRAGPSEDWQPNAWTPPATKR